MAHWLLKTEPSTYAFDDLVRERRTAWTGVANPQAQLNLKAMRAGDAVAVYHTGAVKAAVGLATVARAAYPEPGGGGKLVCVDVAAGEPLAAPVALAALKEAGAFAGSPLLTQGRLSVVPLTAAQWKALLALGGRRPAAGGPRAAQRSVASARARPKAASPKPTAPTPAATRSGSSARLRRKPV